MRYLLEYEDFLNEAEGDFDSDIREWVDLVSANSSRWMNSKARKIIKGTPNKRSLNALANVLKKENNRPGKDELLTFIDKLKMNTYKKDFKNLEGPNGAIDELFKVLTQAIEF